MNKIMKKDIVAGLGEIGLPILKLISKKENAVGYDLDKKLMNEKKFNKLQDIQTRFLHIAIPVKKNFNSNVFHLYKKFKPECIVIHSTISPGTTELIQKKLDIPIIFSATRGIHKRMLKDLQAYTKFFAISKQAPKKNWAVSQYRNTMKKSGSYYGVTATAGVNESDLIQAQDLGFRVSQIAARLRIDKPA